MVRSRERRGSGLVAPALVLATWSPCPQHVETVTTLPSGNTEKTVTYTYKHTDKPDLTPLQHQIAALCGVNDIDYCKSGDVLGRGIRCPILNMQSDTKTCPASASIDMFADLATLIKAEGELSVALDGSLEGQTAGHTHAGREGSVECAARYIVARYDFKAKLTVTAAAGAYFAFHGDKNIHELSMETREDVCVWIDHAQNTGLKCSNPLPDPP